MIRHVAFTGLLVALSCSAFAHEGNDNNNHGELENDVENYEFVFPLEKQCAKTSNVRTEDFINLNTINKLTKHLRKSKDYRSCLGQKTGLVNNDGELKLDNFENAVKNFGYFDKPTFSDKVVNVVSNVINALYLPDRVFDESCSCLLIQIVLNSMSEEERKNFTKLNGPEQNDFVFSHKTTMRIVDAFYGILLTKSAPKSWVANSS